MCCVHLQINTKAQANEATGDGISKCSLKMDQMLSKNKLVWVRLRTRLMANLTLKFICSFLCFWASLLLNERMNHLILLEYLVLSQPTFFQLFAHLKDCSLKCYWHPLLSSSLKGSWFLQFHGFSYAIAVLGNVLQDLRQGKNKETLVLILVKDDCELN